MQLTDDIIRYLLQESDKAITIVFDPKGFLLRTDVSFALQEFGQVHILSGNLLDLRIAYEQIPDNIYHGRPVFVLRDKSLRIMPDIQEHASIFEEFRLNSFFKWYDIDTLLKKSYDELDYCYCHKAAYKLSATDTESRISEYHATSDYKRNAIKCILSQWNQLFANPIFDNLDWLPHAADIVRQAIEADCYDLIEDQIDQLNKHFQAYLRLRYTTNILCSTCPSKGAPKVVTQVLPFIHKQSDDKKALIVVDGMNCWQGGMLVDKLKENISNNIRVDHIYSWLPSVTNLSRQAIFRGDIPSLFYSQSPSSEKNLFESFFYKKQVDKSLIDYIHGGSLEGWRHNVKWLAYVDLTLDDAIHSAKHNGYLLDDTKRWLNENIVEGINSLLDNGFSVYITSDHGNLFTKPYKRLSQGERLGSDGSSRYITLAQDASIPDFVKEHEGHLMQIEQGSRTFYPISNESFNNSPAIAHGGTHWLEVLVPFISIKRP